MVACRGAGCSGAERVSAVLDLLEAVVQMWCRLAWDLGSGPPSLAERVLSSAIRWSAGTHLLFIALKRTTLSMESMCVLCSGVRGPLPTMARVPALAGAMLWQAAAWEPSCHCAELTAKLMFQS